MDQTERKLFEAAAEGNVTSLHALLQEDVFALDRTMVNCLDATPLHIAAMLGHADFVSAVVRRKPELAGELNLRRSSPLHLASAKGYLEIVKSLLSVNPDVCLVCDGDGRNPLHIAAMKGRVGVLRELVGARPQAARALVDRKQTILHLCVKWNQLESLKLLAQFFVNDVEFLNAKDDAGFTILHLSVADKQLETVEYLLMSIKNMEVNAVTANGFTALDILEQSQRSTRDLDIAEALRGAGAVKAAGNNFIEQKQQPPSHPNNWPTIIHQDDWLSRKRDSLMVVASLTATMAFQAGMNPPGGTWQEDSPSNMVESKPHKAGSAVMADNHPEEYAMYLRTVTISLIASLSIILLFVSGLPLKRRLYMWIPMLIMWVAISFVGRGYMIAVSVLTPEDRTLAHVFQIFINTWRVLICFLLLVQTTRLFIILFKKLRRRFSSEKTPSKLIYV